ncbi:vWA domain-containing protein [Candidatus Thiosymbion oneisti]|uniref:vWA domain-containing protein n=1 Tax=Candidatus Thiosymbion oneisti TaxID=589554 RepID=UPI000B7E1797|nr:vWA domain-containing protein [Candidatus Thiosymbion oneisti]
MRLPALLFIALVSACPMVGAAMTAAGTDLIFLIDQSGSMMGKGAAKGTANDKLGKRIEAIKQLDFHLWQSALAGYVNRISVIEFGGRKAKNPQHKLHVTLSHKEIPAVPPGQSPVKTLERIKAILSPIRAVFRGDTDTAAAMALAQQELNHFKQNPPVPGPGAKSGERTAIVVLITDGQPYARGISEQQQQQEIEAWTARIEEDANFKRFLVFGFNDASHYWQNEWGAFWRSVATPDTWSPEGLAFLIDRDQDTVERDQDTVEKIHEVLTELIPPGATTASGDIYTAPAYLKALSFTIDYFRPYLPASEIRVLDPAGKRLTLTDRGEQSAAIYLPHPRPGQYRLRSANAPYRAHVLPIYEQARLTAPLRAVKQYSEETIRYRLEGRGPDGRFVPQANLPPVHFEVELQTPNGSTRRVPVIYDQGSGEVISQAPEPFDTPGSYRLTFTGKTKAGDGTESVVYRSRDDLRVDNATPVQAHFVSPDVGSELVLWRGTMDVPVALGFRHGHTGLDLPVDQVLASGKRLRIGWFATGDEDDDQRPPVELVENGTRLTANLPVDFGQTRWDLLWEAAGIRLRLDPSTPDPWRSDIHYLGIAESGDLWLGPEIRVKEGFRVLWVLAGVLLGLIVGLILLWRFFLVRWLIAHSDKKYKRAPKLTYTVPRNPEQGSKEWPLQGVRTKTEPRRVILAEGDTWSIERFRIKRLRRPGNKVAVELRYRPLGAKKGVTKARLEATNDSAVDRARHQITGLPDSQAADFVLFIGKSGW